MKSLFSIVTILVSVVAGVLGGYHGVVDPEIWHHVAKVLSHENGGGKIILDHPEKAHLAAAYTKVEYHEPYYKGHHHHHHDHHDHHDYHHHLHGYGHGYGHNFQSHYHYPHHHHAPVYKKTTPILVPISLYGQGHHHHHHHPHSHHYRK